MEGSEISSVFDLLLDTGASRHRCFFLTVTTELEGKDDRALRSHIVRSTAGNAAQ